MKTTIVLSLALVVLSPAGAQVFRPEIGSRAAHDGARHHQTTTPRGGGYVYRNAPAVHVGVGFGHGRGYLGHDYGRFYRGDGYGYYSPAYSYYPGYSDAYPYYGASGYYGSGSAAGNGLLLGALAGGIVGNNSGEFRHNGWRGAAWGAGVGWLLGSLVDANRRVGAYERAPTAVVQQAPAAIVAQPATQAAPQQVTIINNYYNNASPMSGANSLFGR